MRIRLKSKFILTIISYLAVTSYADVSVRVNPNPVFVGEVVKYEIKSTIGRPRLKSFPEIDGIRWTDNFPSTKRLNVDKSDVSTYEFTISKPGIYIIPPTQVLVGNQVVETKSVRLTATERRHKKNTNSVKLDESIYLKVDYDDAVVPPEKLYLGQEITLTIKLYVDDRLKIYFDRFNDPRSFTNPDNYFPTLNLENVVYRDYSAQNQHNSKFLYTKSETEVIAGNRVKVFRYQTSISGVEVGTIEGTIQHTVPLIESHHRKQQSRDSFDDEFFSNPRSPLDRIFPHQLEISISPIPVISIPTDGRGDGDYLGLIGKWDVEFSVGRTTVSVGEDTSLTLEIDGTGNIAPLTAPELELPGFRIYPPEINRDVSDRARGTIKWVIVPLNTSSHLPAVTFKTFNPDTEGFEGFEFHPVLTVKEAETHTETGPIIEDYAERSQPKTIKPREIHRATDILYIKKDLGDSTELPLWKNVRGLVTGLAILGPLCYISCLLLTLHNERLQGSVSYKRRRAALRNRRRLFRTIKQSPPEVLPHVIREEVIPFLQAILNLPPGATTTELRERINDKDLAEVLNQAEVGGFMPGQTTNIDACTLIKKVKNLLAIAVCFFISSTGICEDSFEKAGRFYDQGNIEEAESIYRNLLKENSENSVLLFNLGNCAYRKGDYGNAIVHYERARRLKPRDSDIIENLNFVRTQLSLPSIQSKDTPLGLITALRDQFRPDEWLICAGGSWCMMWIVMSINRVKRYSLAIVPVVLASISGLSIAIYFAQNASTYAKNQAIVVSQSSPIFRLPQQTDSGKAKSILGMGAYVAVVEKRSEWSRVRIDKDEGWIKNDALGSIW